MKEMIRITVGLTVSCLVAALVMGSVFIITDKAKKHNEHVNVQQTMLALLGYTKSDPAPPDLNLYTIYRYLIENGEVKTLGYMVPVEKGDGVGYDLVEVDLDGQFVNRFSLSITQDAATEAPERKTALKTVLKPPVEFSFADKTFIARLGSKRLAYLIPGKCQGFKTFINVMLALDQSFSIIGLEIMEHEEDPGLGGEIEQDYFKNQFKGKTVAAVKKIEVIKTPLPEEYKTYLERKESKEGVLPKAVIDTIRSKYQDQDIYALTGATISSKAVTQGVKGIIRKFAYRIDILDNIIDSQHIPVVF